MEEKRRAKPGFRQRLAARMPEWFWLDPTDACGPAVVGCILGVPLLLGTLVFPAEVLGPPGAKTKIMAGWLFYLAFCLTVGAVMCDCEADKPRAPYGEWASRDLKRWATAIAAVALIFWGLGFGAWYLARRSRGAQKRLHSAKTATQRPQKAPDSP